MGHFYAVVIKMMLNDAEEYSLMDNKGFVKGFQSNSCRRKLLNGEIFMADLRFEIKQNIACLSDERGGWTKELNLISWNGNPPKYDIRAWSEDHEKMGKGITLSKEELLALKDVLNELM